MGAGPKVRRRTGTRVVSSARAAASRNQYRHLGVHLGEIVDLEVVHPLRARRVGDRLEPRGGHLPSQGDAQHDVGPRVREVLPGQPEVGEPVSSPQCDLAGGHADLCRPALPDDVVHRTEHRECELVAREEPLRVVHAGRQGHHLRTSTIGVGPEPPSRRRSAATALGPPHGGPEDLPRAGRAGDGEGVRSLASPSPSPSPNAGLTHAEVEDRRRRDGFNELPATGGAHPWRLLLAQLTHLLAVLLWVAAGLALLAGMPELAVAIVVIVLLNGLFAFWQEYRADRSTQRLRALLPAASGWCATAARDGRRARTWSWTTWSCWPPATGSAPTCG